MQILGLDLATLPWPVALLVLVLIGFSVFIFFVYLPLVDEVNRLQDNEEKTLKEIKSKVNGFQTFMLSTFNDYDIPGQIEKRFKELKEYNENRFDSNQSISNEILKSNHDLNESFDRFDSEFKDKVRIELKELKDFNKEYFNNIINSLNNIDRIKQDLLTEIKKLDDKMSNNDNQTERCLDSIREKINNFSNQFDSIKEKLNTMSTLISTPRYPPQYPPHNPHI